MTFYFYLVAGSKTTIFHFFIYFRSNVNYLNMWYDNMTGDWWIPFLGKTKNVLMDCGFQISICHLSTFINLIWFIYWAVGLYPYTIISLCSISLQKIILTKNYPYREYPYKRLSLQRISLLRISLLMISCSINFFMYISPI